MITRIGVAPRKPGIETRAFQAHWAGSHGDLVLSLPGLRRYWQNHPVVDEHGETSLPWPGFDACSDLDFDDLAAMDAAFSSPLYTEAVKTDEGEFVDKALGGLFFGKRRVLDGVVDTASGVRFMRFMRSAHVADPGLLEAKLAGLPSVSQAGARELLIAIAPENAGGHRSIFDAVEALWFADAEAAHAYCRSSEYRERAAATAGIIRGTEHLIARVRAIIDGEGHCIE